MSLVEFGRFDRARAFIVRAALEAEGVPALVFDEGTSIADGSYLAIPVRVMVDADDLAHARELLPDF